MSKFSALVSGLGGFVLLLAFQNCSEAKFEASNSELVPVAMQNTEASGDGTGVIVIGEPADETDEETPTASPSPSPEDPVDDGTIEHPGKNPEKGPKDQPKENQGKRPVTDDSGQNYICVVAGPGKSHKIALVEEVLGAKVGTPQDVCMSAAACTDIISQVFEVKGPYKRGFCPNKNPHVVSLTDAQIQALVDAQKPQPTPTPAP